MPGSTPIDAPIAPAPRRPRIAALDAARALAVVAMVFGHTLDATLSRTLWASPGLALYWKARGLTAPLFMIISGWAVTVAIARGGATGWAVPRGRWRRVLLLLGIGFLLRWPGWGLDRLAAGDPEVWAHFLAFDALHTIALALLAASLVLALPRPRLEQGLVFVALVLLFAWLGRNAPVPAEVKPGSLPPLPWMVLAQAAGGSSPFPLFPWAAYFFLGAAVGVLLPQDRRGAAGMVALGAAALLATWWRGLGELPPGDPVLVLFRSGVVLVLLAGLSLVPDALARRLAPLGRASLGVYAIHVPIVYGWSTWPGLMQRVGPRLQPLEGVALAVAVLLASFAILRGGQAAWRRARGWAARRGRGGLSPELD